MTSIGTAELIKISGWQISNKKNSIFNKFDKKNKQIKGE